MPGGMMGGMGGLLGGLMGGRGGMGGMGGMGGGMNSQQNQNTQQQGTVTVSDVYDVDRWKRADGMDSVENKTNVQQVRDAWDREAEEKKKKSLLTKIKSIFRKKQPETPPVVNGTVTTPEMKKAQKRINNGKEPEQPIAAPVVTVVPDWERLDKNYLGLFAHSDIDSFFTANPVNSAILAVDSLAFGSLTLNQVNVPSVTVVSVPAPASVTDSAPTGAAQEPAAIPAQGQPPVNPVPSAVGPGRNLIAQRAGTDFMGAFHESREQRKYEVKIL